MHLGRHVRIGLGDVSHAASREQVGTYGVYDNSDAAKRMQSSSLAFATAATDVSAACLDDLELSGVPLGPVRSSAKERPGARCLGFVRPSARPPWIAEPSSV